MHLVYSSWPFWGLPSHSAVGGFQGIKKQQGSPCIHRSLWRSVSPDLSFLCSDGPLRSWDPESSVFTLGLRSRCPLWDQATSLEHCQGVMARKRLLTETTSLCPFLQSENCFSFSLGESHPLLFPQGRSLSAQTFYKLQP